MYPLDPSRPLSQRKVYVKSTKCVKTLHSQCWISFDFRPL